MKAKPKCRIQMTERITGEDRLALYGYGLFETMLVDENQVRFSRLHWERLTAGARSLAIAAPTWEEWPDLLASFLTRRTIDAALEGSHPFGLRITLTGGNPSKGIPPELLMTTRTIPYTNRQYQDGVTLCVLSQPRNERSLLAGIKSTNYLENLLAKQTAAASGADEGLWLNTQEKVAEGTVSNIFWVREGKLYTPSLASGCLSGTRRAVVLELAAQMSIDLHVGEYSLASLIAAEEIFLTNALMGIMPVRQIGTQSFAVAAPEDKESLTRRLAAAYQGKLRDS